VIQGPTTIVKMARYYGFRNIQNLVRRLKPAKVSKMPGARTGVSRRPGVNGAVIEGVKEYAYVEVMACPGGCTNGGGQVKVTEVEGIRAAEGVQAADGDALPARPGPKEQKEWLGRVDEAYFSGSEDESVDTDGDQEMQDAHTNGVNGNVANGIGANGHVDGDVINGISRRYIQDVVNHWADLVQVDAQTLLYTSYRKVESDVGKKQNDVERVAGLASSMGGGW
jgi:hypothetical protein